MSWLAPVGSPRGTPFGAAGHMWASGYHTGLDFLAPMGTPVHPCAAGRVIYAGNTHGPYGNQVKIRHKRGLETWYCHLSEISCQPGDTVSPADVIGATGATGNVTGPHLHLEFRVNGVAVDPAPYLDGKKGDAPTLYPGGRNYSTQLGSSTGALADSEATTPVDGGGGADASNAGAISHLFGVGDLRSLTFETLFLLGGFGLVAVGALYAAAPAVKKAAQTAIEATPEGAAVGAATKGL